MVETQSQLDYTPLIRLYIQSTKNSEPLEWVDEKVNYKSLRATEKEISAIESEKTADGFEPVYLAVYSL